MIRTVFAIWLFFGVFISGFARTLTLDECVKLARENYPSVAQYGLLDKTKQLNFANIAKVWLPQGSVGAQITWQNEGAARPDVLTGILAQNGVSYPGLGKTQYRVGLDVSQQIWDGGRNRAGKRAIATGTEVEKSALDVALYDVEARVEELYFSLLLLQESIKSLDQQTTLVDSTLHQVNSLFANGVAMKSDCDQIEAKLLAMKQQRARLIASRSSIARVLGIFTGLNVEDCELAVPHHEEIIGSDATHPNLSFFDRRLTNITAQEEGIHASVMPTVGAFFSGYYGYPGYNMFKNMQNRRLSFNFMVGLKLSWNFGSLYTRKNSLEKLNLEKQMVETERDVFNFNNRMAIAESSGHIEALREVMRNDERILELRRSVVRTAQSQLRNGVIDATSLLTKITDEELAENELVTHRIELIKAIYNLNHLRNK